MRNDLSEFRALRRPPLLLRAARHILDADAGCAAQRRTLRSYDGSTGAPTLRKLLRIEAEYETMRKAKDATYSIPRHVDALSALIHEARNAQTLRAA